MPSHSVVAESGELLDKLRRKLELLIVIVNLLAFLNDESRSLE